MTAGFRHANVEIAQQVAARADVIGCDGVTLLAGPRRGLTCRIPRVSSRISASRTAVRETSNSVARACSPRRVPARTPPERMASTITRSIGGDFWFTRFVHQTSLQVPSKLRANHVALGLRGCRTDATPPEIEIALTPVFRRAAHVTARSGRGENLSQPGVVRQPAPLMPAHHRE